MVNLLPKTAWEVSFWGRFFKWAVTTGRYIVILTELVVIAAFLSRFKLDKDYADLGDRINGKKTVLTSMAETEKRFRLAQGRLVEAERILENQLKATETLDKVTAKVPVGTILESLTISKKEILVEATAESNTGMGVFLSRLGRASITSLAGGQAGIKFSLKLWPN